MSPAVGILEAMGSVVHFPPAASPEPSPGHPVRHVPSLAGAVEAYFAGRDLAAETRRTYRKALTPPRRSCRRPASYRHRPATGGGRVRGAVGWLRGGDVEHPEGRGAGLRRLVPRQVAA